LLERAVCRFVCSEVLFGSFLSFVLDNNLIEITDESNCSSKLCLAGISEKRSCYREEFVKKFDDYHHVPSPMPAISSAASISSFCALCYSRFLSSFSSSSDSPVFVLKQEPMIDKYYFLADLSAISITYSYQQQIRQFSWNDYSSLRWLFPSENIKQNLIAGSTSVEIEERKKAHPNETSLEYLDYNDFVDIVQSDRISTLLGRKLMFLSLEKFYFSSFDFGDPSDATSHRTDGSSADPFDGKEMVHNIELVPSSNGENPASSSNIQYCFKPAFFHFTKPLSQQRLKDILLLDCFSTKEGSAPTKGEVWSCLSVYQAKENFKLLHQNTEENPVFNAPSRMKMKKIDYSHGFSGKHESSQLVTSLKSSADYLQQSQLMSQLYYTYADSPEAESEKLTSNQTDHDSNQVHIPVTAYDSAISDMFFGVSANLVALSLHRQQQSNLSTPSLNFAKLCSTILLSLPLSLTAAGNGCSEISEDHLVIISFVRSWNEVEGSDFFPSFDGGIHDDLGDGSPSSHEPKNDVYGSSLSHSVIAVLERFLS
jgi:hypothetical protein